MCGGNEAVGSGFATLCSTVMENHWPPDARRMCRGALDPVHRTIALRTVSHYAPAGPLLRLTCAGSFTRRAKSARARSQRIHDLPPAAGMSDE